MKLIRTGNVVDIVDGEQQQALHFNNTEHARRYVASTIACEGIRTDTLEAFPNFGEAGHKTIVQVERERDDLAQLMREILDDRCSDIRKSLYQRARVMIDSFLSQQVSG